MPHVLAAQRARERASLQSFGYEWPRAVVARSWDWLAGPDLGGKSSRQSRSGPDVPTSPTAVRAAISE